VKRYIAFDCESGGVTVDKTLLTVYFEVLDDNLGYIDSGSLKIKPDDGIYKCTAEALNVNKISIPQHDEGAMYEKECRTVLFNWLSHWSNSGKIKLIPLGHNVYFDIKFIQAHLISQDSWEQFVSYRVRDTASLAGAAQDAGLIPPSVTGSLKSLCEHYGIVNQAAHTSKGDVQTTIALYKHLLEAIRG
jgi:DNA polymerase III alpha subunit (gram-positive type)